MIRSDEYIQVKGIALLQLVSLLMEVPTCPEIVDALVILRDLGAMEDASPAECAEASLPLHGESGTDVADSLQRGSRALEQGMYVGQIHKLFYLLDPAYLTDMLQWQEQFGTIATPVKAVLAARGRFLQEMSEKSPREQSIARTILNLGSLFHCAMQLRLEHLQQLAEDETFPYSDQAAIVLGLRGSLDDTNYGPNNAGVRLERGGA